MHVPCRARLCCASPHFLLCEGLAPLQSIGHSTAPLIAAKEGTSDDVRDAMGHTCAQIEATSRSIAVGSKMGSSRLSTAVPSWFTRHTCAHGPQLSGRSAVHLLVSGHGWVRKRA